jgi:hypothetical protein
MQEKRLPLLASLPKNLAGEEPDPLAPEEMERAIMEMPRDRELIDLLSIHAASVTSAVKNYPRECAG